MSVLWVLWFGCAGKDVGEDTEVQGDSGEPVGTAGCEVVPVCEGDPLCHFTQDVEGLSVSCSDETGAWVMHVEATGIPDHAYSDPQGQVWDQAWSFDIPLEPDAPTSFQSVPCPSGADMNQVLFGPKGIAINGVSLYYPLSIDFVDPLSPPDGYDAEQLDYCDAHGAGGAYHYHVNPTCLYGVYQNGEPITGVVSAPPTDLSIETSFARGEWPKPSGVIGFSTEGFPVYGPYADAAGGAHTGLDACNGKLDADGNYGYYATDTFPYLLGCRGGGVALANTIAGDWACTTNLPEGAGQR